MMSFGNNPIYPLLSTVLSTWTEPETCFGLSHLVALSKHFKRSNLAQKNLNYMHGLKSAILAIFQKGLGWPCPVSVALKNAS